MESSCRQPAKVLLCVFWALTVECGIVGREFCWGGPEIASCCLRCWEVVVGTTDDVPLALGGVLYCCAFCAFASDKR